mgnify:CR=1 FL=1
MPQSYEDLLAVLPEPVRERVAVGELLVFPGQKPEKPVLRDAVTGALVKGTGLTPKHNDMALVSQKGAYKRRKGYREDFEIAVPADDNPKVVGSVGWIIAQLHKAIEGVMETIKVTCEECGHKQTVDAYRKVDSFAAIKLLELAHGRARETQDINVNVKELHKVLEERTPKNEIRVHAIDPDEAKRRREVIQGEFRELD